MRLVSRLLTAVFTLPMCPCKIASLCVVYTSVVQLLINTMILCSSLCMCECVCVSANSMGPFRPG